MIPHAEKLIEKAQKGATLTPKERRHCIAFITATTPETTNEEMAQLFGVSEKMIRLDRKSIRETRAKMIREDDISLVIADIAILLDKQIRDIERSKRKTEEGTRTYLEHCKAAFDLQMKAVQALQNLGYYPKNLGNMTVESFEYKAEVGKDGSVNTRPVNMSLDVLPVIDAEFQEVKALPPGTVEENS